MLSYVGVVACLPLLCAVGVDNCCGGLPFCSLSVVVCVLVDVVWCWLLLLLLCGAVCCSLLCVVVGCLAFAGYSCCLLMLVVGVVRC